MLTQRAWSRMLPVAAALVLLSHPIDHATGPQAEPDAGHEERPASGPVSEVGHEEVPVAPPLFPVRREDQPTSPRGIAVRGLLQSIQVNVDAQNQNIVGDAANEPSMAIDPTNPDRIVIGWRQFDTVTSSFRQAGYAYSTDGGLSWTFPGVLDPGQFRSDPVLAADSSGTFFYYSLSSSTSGDVFLSGDGGVNWIGPISAPIGDKNWMTIDTTGGAGDGHFYGIWNSQFTCCAEGTDFTRSTDGGFTYEGPFVMPEHSKWGTVDVGPGGEVYVVGATLDQSSHLVLRSVNAVNSAQVPVFDLASGIDLGGTTPFAGTPNPGGLVGQAWVAVDRSGGATDGNVYALASVDPPGPDPLDVMFIRSLDGGLTWSAPLRVNDETPVGGAHQWFGTMSVAPNGRIDAVWNDTRQDPSAENSELYHAYSTDGGVTWSGGLAVSPPFNSLVGHPQQNKIGDYYHMVSDLAGGAVAYSATFNGEQDVYFLRVGDCNQNGVHDSIDAGATSTDCNANAVPDECEPDCNGNGTADGCDIAGGTSGDCNGNALPDECEPDCNGNGAPDVCDIAGGASSDCNGNVLPDECDAAAGAEDCNSDGLIDECDVLFDLETDQGWTVGAIGDGATGGVWVRVDPVGTAAQPEDDHTPGGTTCFVTGQGTPGGALGAADVDGGKTTVRTPPLNLTAFVDPSIGYWRWYSNDAGSFPNQDVFTIDVSNNGTSWTNVEVVGPTGPEVSGGWFFHRFRVADLVTPTSQVYLRFVAADLGNGSVIEAAIDDLVVIDCVQCTVNGDCDDGQFCNGPESCQLNACVDGIDPCDDGDSCTLDSCGEGPDECTNVAPPVPLEVSSLLLGRSTPAVAVLTWDPRPEATSYDVYRGTLHDASDLVCFITGLPTPTTPDDGLVPAPGEVLYYVITAVNCSGVAPLGSDRTPAVPC